MQNQKDQLQVDNSITALEKAGVQGSVELILHCPATN
jgi:hypothetical protein